MVSTSYSGKVLRTATVVAVVATIALASGCAADTARRVRPKAELAIGASLIGVLASSSLMAAIPQHKEYVIPVTLSFGGLAVASAVVFGVAYGNSLPPRPAPLPEPPPDRRPEAWELTKRAQGAARANDCASVLDLDAKVRALDESFHALVFLRDVAIARCL